MSGSSLLRMRSSRSSVKWANSAMLANSSIAEELFRVWTARKTSLIVATSSALPPTNIPLSNEPAFNATNYDRQIAVCYGLGEYQSVASSNGSVYVAWGDDRNQLTEPVNPLNPISGQTHPEQDVFAQKVKVQ